MVWNPFKVWNFSVVSVTWLNTFKYYMTHKVVILHVQSQLLSLWTPGSLLPPTRLPFSSSCPTHTNHSSFSWVKTKSQDYKLVHVYLLGVPSLLLIFTHKNYESHWITFNLIQWMLYTYLKNLLILYDFDHWLVVPTVFKPTIALKIVILTVLKIFFGK